MTKTEFISDITIEDNGASPPTPEVEQERRVAINDLLQDNTFSLCLSEKGCSPKGPYDLTLSVKEGRLFFKVCEKGGSYGFTFQLSLSPLRQTLKDYSDICKSYFDAVKRLPPSKIEAIDMARRGIHSEGGQLLRNRLSNKAILDIKTARRLFTLIFALHIGI